MIANMAITLRLNLSAAQQARLRRLQLTFSEACNFVFPFVATHRCWNRVALHHLAYRAIRENFPELGSQMACNVIYSVSKTAKSVYQNPTSPYFVEKLEETPLPTLKFPSNTPVFLDRHTLSIRNDGISIFTLDGRLKFRIEISAEFEKRLFGQKIKEIILFKDKKSFAIQFHLAQKLTTSSVGQNVVASGQKPLALTEDSLV